MAVGQPAAQQQRLEALVGTPCLQQQRLENAIRGSLAGEGAPVGKPWLQQQRLGSASRATQAASQRLGSPKQEAMGAAKAAKER